MVVLSSLSSTSRKDAGFNRPSMEFVKCLYDNDLKA